MVSWVSSKIGQLKEAVNGYFVFRTIWWQFLLFECC